jgi:hypothetical protein
MANGYGAKFEQVKRLLQKHCPTTKPITVYVKNLHSQQLCGCCLAYLDRLGRITRFELKIDRSLSQLTAIDTLLHEWAHAMDQDQNGLAREPHRSSWGKCYAKVWRVYAAHLDN